MLFCHSKKLPLLSYQKRKLIYKNDHTTIEDISVNSINCRKIPAMLVVKPIYIIPLFTTVGGEYSIVKSYLDSTE